MKILVINSEYPPVGGGAGNASAHIARLLAGMGNEVLVLTSQHNSLPEKETCDGLTILRGPTRRRYADRSSAYEQVLFMAGAAVRSLTLLRSFRPQVTLAFFGLPSGAVAWLLKALAGVPYVVSLRGGDVPGFRPYDFWLYHKIAVPWLHLIWHGAAAVVANSQGLYDLAHSFDSRVPIVIIRNGVDADEFRESGRLWSPPRLLSVGRVVYQKGYDLAMSALAGLSDLPWEWKIVGDGPFLKTLRHMAAQYDLNGRVHFPGWESAEAVKKEYAWANLFLHPSRHEGMPNAVLEAMASGLPVVATRIAGNEELVVDSENGVLVPVDSADLLQGSLRKLLQDAALRHKMGHLARLRVEQAFGWQRVAEQYQAIFEQVI